ncbi:unnamed protein product [Acanthoscelides obtectus]|uniref:Uncharacterized protein n=1 Tax=Acanthoscelides obtectus TaxID=200917 RepID=A0A9P0JNW4_ACAOB|nr:unnamed protein product [Acanthoscelides obtectus]CAK1661839.1 SCAN domain-containing protein 3 [Acanthoscelides obtectus]
MIAKQKKPYTIGEELIKPCVLKATQIILGEDAEQKMKSISLSNNIVKRRIDDIAAVTNKINKVRYIGGYIIQEVILYSQSLTAATTSVDIFNSISNFVEKNDLDWKKLIGLCTDGAPAMIGVRSGLAKKLKVSTRCVIHRQPLSSKTLLQKLCQALDSAITFVNYIKSSALNSRLFTLRCEDIDSEHKVLLFHTEGRWLSKGNMLTRLHELKEED